MAEISRLGHAEQVEDILVPMKKLFRLEMGRKLIKRKSTFLDI